MFSINKKSFLLLLLVYIGCNSSVLKKNIYLDSGWTDCNSDITKPFSRIETFEGKNYEGFWVTVVDSTDLLPLPGAVVLYGSDSKTNTTGVNGSLWINTDKTDTLYVSFISFDPGSYYRSSVSIDSVVVYLSECTIVFAH